MGRISKEVKMNISETQGMVIESLLVDNTMELPPSRNQVLEAVSQCADEVVEANLGAAGKTLKRYVSQIMMQHPEMSEITRDKQWELFSRDVFQALAVTGGSSECKNKVNNLYKPLIRQFLTPKPRLVRDTRRNELRESKKHTKHIGLKQVYMLGENGFYGKPDSFKMFVRNSTAHVDEITCLEDQQNVFSAHNMPEVAHAVNKRIKGMEEMRDSSYMGFHRMKPTDAAMIVARMVGLQWHELHFLTVPFKFFEHTYWPEVMDRKEEEKQKDEMKRLLVMKDRKMAFVDSTAFTYQPRLYPLAKFTNLPKSVVGIISTVESFPELNGCPVFDYYWVLVPSININHPYFRHKDGWKVYAKNIYGGLELRSYQDEYEAALALDTALIADGYFPPVILAEREGKCFFLSMWCD